MIQKAFMLGAGLGTRLRPLTDRLPKPLVPLFHRPLIEWGMMACRDLGISQFAINTHHLPDEWQNRDGKQPLWWRELFRRWILRWWRIWNRHCSLDIGAMGARNIVATV